MDVKLDKRVEYLYKKTTYIFPKKATITLNGNKLIVEVNHKKIEDISEYISKRKYINRRYNYKIGLPVTRMGSQLAREYQAITSYLDKNPDFNFLHFDYATSYELALCTFFKPIDFIKEVNLIHTIHKEMPHLINIFKRPLIHLKEKEEIQLVDTVKRINHNTIRHLSTHDENWKSIKRNANTIVPSKLLTRVYDDDYSIYENVVFRDLIDKILLFFRKRMYFFNEIIEKFKESIQLNNINWLNHQKYYLAIGKLYVGFYKLENSSEILNMLENIKKLYIEISKYKGYDVYAKNVNVRPLNGEIKKTNILTMHKDYQHVYFLHQKFKKKTIDSQENGNHAMQVKAQESYEHFCQMLILFAASNFNMICNSSEAIFKDNKMDINLEYKVWSLNIKTEFNTILDFNTIAIHAMHKDKSVRFLIIPMSYYIAKDKKMQYETIIERLYHTKNIYDKYIFFEPFEEEDGSLYNYSIQHQVGNIHLFYAILPISITEINSFLRIQKLLLECLVLSDENYDVCAFCGEKMVHDFDNHHICKKCRTAIKTVTCSQCKKDFVATYVAIKSKNHIQKKEIKKDPFEDLPDFYKQEKLYSYRNIINMHHNNFICPHCGCENKNINASHI